MKPKAAEGDRRPDHITLRGDARTRVPERVPRIVRALPLREERVGLDSHRIDVEDEAVTLVVKRIERDFDVVVGVKWLRRLAPGHMSADRTRVVIKTDEHYIK